MNNKFTDENISTHIKSIEDERSVLIPKIKPVDLSVKNDNAELPDTLSLYNKILTDYESTIGGNDSTPISSLNEINNIQVNNNQLQPNNGLLEHFSSMIDNNNSFKETDIFKRPLNSVYSPENILFKEPEYKVVEKKILYYF